MKLGWLIGAMGLIWGNGLAISQELDSSASLIHWNARREIFLVTGGLLANVGANSMLRDPPATNPLAEDKSQLWWIDRWNAGTYRPEVALLSDVLVFPITGAMPLADLGLYLMGKSDLQPMWEDALILSEALAWSSALGLWVRSSEWHPRPFVFSSKAPWKDRTAPEAGGSFYSGHTNSSFVGISVLATLLPARFPEVNPAWLWVGGGVAAAGVGGLRILAGKHYPTDVVAGAAMGSLFGWSFAKWHLKPKGSRLSKATESRFTVIPIWSGGLAAIYRF